VAQLIILGGLPGAGKTTIARELSRRTGALHLRIDTIEQALRSAGLTTPMDDAGYRVAYSIAEDNLRLGHTVIADSVNPIAITREAWRAVAARAGVPSLEVEVVCSDPTAHRTRVETREADIPGLKQPTWQDVQARDYEPWTTAALVVDTTAISAEEGARIIEARLEAA
jgi:predicted kinase